MTMTEIVLKVLESNPNAKAFRFRTKTTPKLTKKNRTTKAPTDFVLEIESEFTASLGVNYQDEVNKTLAEAGQTADFRSEKPNGKHYVNGTNWLMESDSNPGKFYIALSRFKDRTTHYLVNGNEVTDRTRIDDIYTNYMPKQGTGGIVEWKTYSVESIVSVEPIR